MKVIVNKLDLPYDIKWVINSYLSNKLGYTDENLKEIEQIKGRKRNKFMKLRQKLELAVWYKFNVSVSWLTHGGRGNGWYGKKSPKNVWGGGTLAESEQFRYYNGITYCSKRINDPENDHIEKMIETGDRSRARI